MNTGKSYWQKVILWLCAYKVLFLLLAAAAVMCFPQSFDTLRAEGVAFMKPKELPWPSPNVGLAKHFTTWDAAHYILLSHIGYSNDLKSCAFYPLFPLTIRTAAPLFGGDHLLTGIALSNVFSATGLTLFYLNVFWRFGKSIAVTTIFLIIAFPGALFFQFVYTESLFLLLTMSLWSGLERRWWVVACIAGLLLPLTRAIGIFCILPMAWLWLMDRASDTHLRWKWLDNERQRVRANRMKTPTMRPIPTWTIMGPLAGLGLYFGLMWYWTGNAFEGFEAQGDWRAHSVSNLWNLPKFIVGFFTPTTWHSFRGSLLDRVAFVLLLYCIPLVWRLGADMMIWIYALALVPAMSGTFVSYIRFESTAFPLFIALGLYFSGRSRGHLTVIILVALVLQAILAWRFLNYKWAG